MRDGFRDVNDVLGEIIDEQEAALGTRKTDSDQEKAVARRPASWFDRDAGHGKTTYRIAG